MTHVVIHREIKYINWLLHYKSTYILLVVMIFLTLYTHTRTLAHARACARAHAHTHTHTHITHVQTHSYKCTHTHTQYSALSRRFRDVMEEYNQMQEEYREKSKVRIEKQLKYSQYSNQTITIANYMHSSISV